MAYGGRLCRVWCLYPCCRSRSTTNRLTKDFCVLGVLVLLILVLLECFLSTNDPGGHDVNNNNARNVLMTLEGPSSMVERRNVGDSHKDNHIQEPWFHKPIPTSSPHLHNKYRVIPTLPPRSEGQLHRGAQIAQAPGPWMAQRPSAGPRVSWNKVPLQNQLPGTDNRWQHVKNRTRKGTGGVGGVLREAPQQLLAGLRNSQSDQGKHAQIRFRQLENTLSFRPLPVSRSATPTTGEPWPHPQSYRITNLTSVYVIDVTKTPHVITGMTCDVIEKGVQRHKMLLEELHQAAQQGERMRRQGMERGWRLLSRVDIKVLYKCDKYPTLESDESYEMFIKNNTLHLHASEVWGALQGLQTLSQVIAKSKGHLIVKDIHITDFPRFKHRGVMLDTGRHYLSTAIILKNLDAMAMNKFNVFHWHLVDDQSFPYQSQVFPQLSLKGAYTRQAVYTQEDISSVVEYARLRGIRVIPELDTPGHMESWVGLAEILTPCGHPTYYGPIDPTRNTTYTKLTELFREVLDRFPSGTVHMGGDECSYYCWSKYRNITDFMNEHNMKDDFKALFNYYFTRLQTEMKKKLKPKLKNSIYWQEVFDEGVRLDSNAIVHVWKDDYTPKLTEVTRAGHRAVLSSCWYLNYIKYGKDWSEYYMCDPQVFAGTRQQKDLVIGGEACMWGEYVDDNNLLSDLWPRASAVAERLWSAQSRSNPYIAEGRFEEHRCRMIRRGIPAKAIGGPGPPCTDPGTT